MIKKAKFFVFAVLSSAALSCLPTHAQERAMSAQQEQARIARGAYLVEGLGHCGACHTPRGIGMQEQAYSSQSPEYLSGAVIEGWLASSLRTITLSRDEIVTLLKEGVSPSKGISGPMKEVVTLSMQYATDEDLESIADYLISIRQPLLPQKGLDLPTETSQDQGKFLYYTYCSVCHGESGEGVSPVAPKLAGNSNVMAQDPRNMMRIIMHGEESPVTMAHPPYVMPAYAKTLTSEQMVKVMNYMRSAWGNQAAPITEKQYNDLLK